MGLSGRKVKQRIGADPRNLSWADNASKFGQVYLEKLGWDSSKGLGVSGEGRTSALKVTQKLDMLGIGSQHQNSAEGIAWRQNRDFESLLRRLNGAAVGGNSEDVPSGFHRAKESVEDNTGDETDNTAVKREGKKRKKLPTATDESDEPPKKRKKEDKKKRKEDKKKRKENQESTSNSVTDTIPNTQVIPNESKPDAAPAPSRILHRSHRARHLSMKRLATSTSKAMSEILGIPSSSTSATQTPTTPDDLPTQEVSSVFAVETLTTSTQSVADYFKAKLAAKSTGSCPNNGSSRVDNTEEDVCTTRPGLGSTRSCMASFGDHDSRPVVGFTSKFASMFTVDSTCNSASREDTEIAGDETAVQDINTREERKRIKEARRLKKAERKRLKTEQNVSRASVETTPADEALVEERRNSLSKDKHKSKLAG